MNPGKRNAEGPINKTEKSLIYLNNNGVLVSEAYSVDLAARVFGKILPDKW